MKLTIVFLTIAALLAPSLGRIYDQCSLAQALRNLGVPYNDIATYVCLALHESNYNTAAVGPPNSDGSNDYGIFQLNDLYWCSPPNGRFSYNYCGTSCNSFLTDDIGTATRCAESIRNSQGFSAWSTYYYCYNPPSVNQCF